MPPRNALSHRPDAAAFALRHGFADELPELARPSYAAATPAPKLLAFNDALAAQLGLPAELSGEPGLRILTGEHLPRGARPVAQVYAGHQWGVFKPILGDGRALLLGEIESPDGTLVDLHLKGIGPTPMSRIDGFAAIAPMLREYLLGEAMHALGVPTTRALSVVATGARHRRDADEFEGAVLARTARSHLRIGSFQYARAIEDLALLRRLADHAIARLHPEAATARDPYRALFAGVVDAHIRLTADWLRLGFVHGVLSTDNVTISGETIDYGPCAFIDRYDPRIWFSSIDAHGRYAFNQQAPIMAWNLGRLGDALAPLLGANPADAHAFVEHEQQRYLSGVERRRIAVLGEKLGLKAGRAEASGAPAVESLIDDLLALLEYERLDFTGFFRSLADAAEPEGAGPESAGPDGADLGGADLGGAVRDGADRDGASRVGGRGASSALAGHDAVVGAFSDPRAITTWLAKWRSLRPSAELMRSVNPVYIPRNHLLDAALESAAAGDIAPFRTLLDLVTQPFSERPDADPAYALPAPVDAAPHRTFCGT